MKKMIWVFFTFFLSLTWASGSNLSITNLTYDPVTNSLTFDISWDNGFYISSEWSDHIYIFAKYKNSNGSNWEPVFFEASGHTDDNVDMLFGTAPNSTLIDGKRLAMMASHNATFQSGSTAANCTAVLADNIDFIFPSFKIFGIEMIKCSNVGFPYYLGDGSSPNRWHRGDNINEPYYWDGDFDDITVGNTSSDINTIHTSGIPVTTFDYYLMRTPNNIMRYEISQQQYVDFLNCLNRTAQNNRVATDISGTSITDVYVMTQTSTPASYTRNGIRCDSELLNGGSVHFYCDYNGNGIGDEYDDGQNIAANYLSGADVFAYLDWAGLRPMNEFQYEGFSRGVYLPVPGEYAWGTSGYTAATLAAGASTYGSPDEVISNLPPVHGPMRISANPMRCGAAANATTDRISSGATAWGSMEMSGNVAEIVRGMRNASDFIIGTVGDGTITLTGYHDESWPSTIVTCGMHNVTGQTVSERQENTTPYESRSGLNGGRGVY